MPAAHDQGPRFPLELSRGIRLLWFHHIDHVMVYAVPIRLRWLGRADVHAPVNLHAVHGENRSIQLLGQAQGDLALSGGRGAENGEQSGQAGCPIK